MILKKLKNKKAITLIEVLVAIVLTSVIMLSMTRLIVVVLRNSTENERYDQAIQEFAKAEETFKAWYLLSSGNFLKEFCKVSNNRFVDVTKKIGGASDSLVSTERIGPTDSIPYLDAGGKDVQAIPFDGITKYLKSDSSLPDGMLVSVQIENNNTTENEIKANSYVYWETNGKKYYFTNSIYIYTAERCPLI